VSRSRNRWKGPVPKRTNKSFESGSPKHEEYKAKQREYYRKTRELQRGQANRRISAKRLRNQKWMVEYMKGKSCPCGVDDPRVLTFNHLEPENKFANIADLVSRGAKLEHIIAEVEKCEIVCHNCHMLITLEALGGSYHDKLREEDKT